MRQITICFTVIFSAVLLFGCGSNSPNTATNSSAANTGNSNNPLETKTPAPEAVTNDAPTLAPTYKAFCDAWVKSDEVALRKVYSADSLRQFEKEMKEENAKNLIKYLESTDRVSGNPCYVKNEKINGDTATGKIFSNKYPNGIDIVFVKESGEWKITTRSPTIDNMKPSAPNSNTAK